MISPFSEEEDPEAQQGSGLRTPPPEGLGDSDGVAISQHWPPTQEAGGVWQGADGWISFWTLDLALKSSYLYRNIPANQSVLGGLSS